MALPEPLSHDATAVVTVADKYPRLLIHELFHMLVVVFVGRGKNQGSKPVLMVNGSMVLSAKRSGAPLTSKFWSIQAICGSNRCT